MARPRRRKRDAAAPAKGNRLLPFIERATEAGWLAAVGLIPLAMAHEQWMFLSVSVPKIFLLRTAALYLALLMFWKLTLSMGSVLARGRFRLVAGQARLVFVAVGGMLAANLASSLLSLAPSVSIGGIDAGGAGSSVLNVTSHLVIFAVMATHLRTREQISRLLAVVLATAAAMSLLAIGQRFGIDPFQANPVPTARVPMTSGNPLFAASVLVMMIPLSMSAFLMFQGAFPVLWRAIASTSLLSIQLIAIGLTLSRGPWVALAIGILVFVALCWRLFGSKQAASIGSTVLVSLTIAGLFLSAIPEAGQTAASRIESLTEGTLLTAGSGGERVEIWTTATSIFTHPQWVSDSSVPNAGSASVRRIFGWGPDLFTYPYQVARDTSSKPNDDGHNLLIHTLVELGLLGVLAYVTLGVALAITLVLIARATPRMQMWQGFLLAGLAGAFTARVAEQMVGVAQESDTLIAWVVAALIVAMATPPSTHPAQPLHRFQKRNILAPVGIASAFVVTGLVGVFWWQSIFGTFLSYKTGLDGRDAARSGDIDQMVETYLDAIDQGPSVAINRLGLAEATRVTSASISDAAERLAVLEIAAGFAQSVLDRNPLDTRALRVLTHIERDMTTVQPSNAARALATARTWQALTPTFYQPLVLEASILIAIGDFSGALERLHQARNRGGEDGRSADELNLLEALALQGLGRTEDAIAAVERAISIRGSDVATTLLQQLQMVQEVH
jgi:hypothetical protein